jgi:hypothetical protein
MYHIHPMKGYMYWRYNALKKKAELIKRFHGSACAVISDTNEGRNMDVIQKLWVRSAFFQCITKLIAARDLASWDTQTNLGGDGDWP